jgi:hypothetical protein
MGQTTPNIAIYIPAAGETNYDASFAAGMVNIDQHDHSGGPNKGVPIASAGIADGSITYPKLNANVVDPTTGIGVNAGLPNQIQMLGILKNLYQLATATGFLTKNGSAVAARTFQNSSTVTWTNADGSGGNPSAAVNLSGLIPLTVPDGGTGLTTLNAWDILCGGTTSTGNLQQVSGEGTAGQVLTSNGAAALPTWQSIPAQTGNLLIATVSMNATQFTNLSGSPVQLIPAPGAGKVIVPFNIVGKLIYGGSAAFGAGSAASTYWGATGATLGPCGFNTGEFKASADSYYFGVNFAVSLGAIASASIENQPLVLSVSGANYTGGTGNVVNFSIQYCIISI